LPNGVKGLVRVETTHHLLMRWELNFELLRSYSHFKELNWCQNSRD